MPPLRSWRQARPPLADASPAPTRPAASVGWPTAAGEDDKAEPWKGTGAHCHPAPGRRAPSSVCRRDQAVIFPDEGHTQLIRPLGGVCVGFGGWPGHLAASGTRGSSGFSRTQTSETHSFHTSYRLPIGRPMLPIARTTSTQEMWFLGTCGMSLGRRISRK